MKNKFFIIAAFIGLLNHLQAQNKIEIDLRTGDDNLEQKEFQENPEVRIIVNGREDIIKTSINRGSTWPNNSIRRVIIDLPGDINVDDLKEIHIHRRPVYGRDYVWDYLKKDNWTLKGLTVTATIKVNGENKRFELLNLNTRGNVFRFIYEGGDNRREGTFFKAALKQVPTLIEKVPDGNAKITAVFGTGADNLEGGNSNNVNLIIRFKSSSRVVSVTNLNKKAKWENNTVHTINNREIQGTLDIDINDIGVVELRHTGGGGTFADNWNLDKFKLTITKGTGSKVLVDEVKEPIHRFTGESRKKVFAVE